MTPVSTNAPPLKETDKSLQRDWAKFTALNFLFAFGFAIYASVFQNFFNDVVHGTPRGLGAMESIREIPGLLTAITAGTLVALAEARVAALGLGIAGIGIGLTGATQAYVPLVLVTVFWSVGFHLWAGMSSAITLTLAKGQEGGRHLGRISSVSAVATMVGLGLALLFAKVAPSIGVAPQALYRWNFALGGVCICAAAVLCATLSSHAAGAVRAPIIFRKEYRLFYLLTFLEGCRRQIFSIFASFVLIKVYHQPLERMLLLQFVNNILISLTAPKMGKFVDKHGERTPLTIYAVGLILVFLGYAVSTSIYILCFLFILDNVLFTFGVGFTTYLHRIVRPNELTPCLNMGVTMNHIAAVTIPIGGAWLWEHFRDYRIPFWIGASVACISLITTRRLPLHQKASPQ
ncbi:MFS transporter [Armatimonadota bacterium]|nr:MFS transporter [Armatimonadota bacterium]